MKETKGSFTLPGEAGYEELTLKLAARWGADVIRDSDGTKLSDEIVKAGYGIYSTICIIREHNEWAKTHMEQLQQTFLCTPPVMADGPELEIDLLAAFFKEQFAINESSESMRYWQVYDRTEEAVLSPAEWTYESGRVIMKRIKPWHEYMVSFLVYRIWEEINMYNHVTNNWNKEHLLPVDPRSPEAQEFLYGWLENWCETNPDTTVVRFTSLFYNFVWIWGSHERKRTVFSDWGSYDFTVSPAALDEFEQVYGYALTAEDFVNQGQFRVSHMPPPRAKRDYMQFTNRFVIEFGRKLVDLVHRYGKQAYVFYDDSWIGLEPGLESFQEFGFDGIIKCIFSGFEVRLCAQVKVPVHEVRLHPYLFPVGLGGTPTFSGDGDPTLDAKKYFVQARRAMLRAKIERIGLGGYLHLVEGYPDFVDYIASAADEFRQIKALHEAGGPADLPVKAAVLTAWGEMRAWTLSGHFHETYMHDLIHVLEALSGLPVAVEFISFEDVKAGRLQDMTVLINAGYAGNAWSGGDAWKDAGVVAAVNQWVYEGGTFLGVGEPSAADGYSTFFRLAAVLGVDLDKGARVCHGKWSYEIDEAFKLRFCEGIAAAEKMFELPPVQGIYLTDPDAAVMGECRSESPLGEVFGTPTAVYHPFGSGRGIYLSHFQATPEYTRWLLNLITDAAGQAGQIPATDNAFCECAWYPAAKSLVVINNSGEMQETQVRWEGSCHHFVIEAYDMEIKEL